VFIECDEIEEWKPSQKEKIFFLGKMMGVDKTINVIQKRTGTKVIFGILHRFNLRQYSLVIESYQDILLQIGRNTSSVGEAVLKSFEQYIYSYPEEWYQWKNFAEIEALQDSSMYIERSKYQSLLRPFFARVS